MTQNYEPPRIEAVSRHFVPDNSGDCCPVCGDGVYEGYKCDECPPWRWVHDYDDKNKERKIAEWPEPKLWEYAEHVPDYGPELCLKDVYPLRSEDGIGHLVCYFCLEKNHDVSQLAFCNECYFFYPKQVGQQGRCKWCTEQGTAHSLFHAAGVHKRLRFDSVFYSDFVFEMMKMFWYEDGVGKKRKVDECYRHRRWYGNIPYKKFRKRFKEKEKILNSVLDELVANRFLYKRVCNCEKEYRISMPSAIDMAEDRMKEYGKLIQRQNKYEELINCLDSPKYRSNFADFLVESGRRGDIEYHYGNGNLSDVFDQVGVHYYSADSNEIQALRFIAKHEWQRFAHDTDVGHIFKAYSATNPLHRIEYVLENGISLGWALESAGDLARKTWSEMGEKGNLLNKLTRQYPQVPRILWYLQILENGYYYYRPKDHPPGQVYPNLSTVLKEITKDEGLALALLAWGFWQYEDFRRFKYARWWKDLASRLAQKKGSSVTTVFDRSRSYAEGKDGLPQPAEEHWKALEPFMDNEGMWSQLAKLLSGKTLKCGSPESDFYKLIEMSRDYPSLQPDIDLYLKKKIEQLGGERYLKKQYRKRGVGARIGLNDFLKRTGELKVLFNGLEHEIKEDPSWRNLGDTYSWVCMKLGRTEALRRHLRFIRSQLNKQMKEQTSAKDACPRAFAVIYGFLKLAMVEGALGNDSKMREWVDGAIPYLEHRIAKCQKEQLPVTGFDLMLKRLKILQEELSDKPEQIADFIEANQYMDTRPVESVGVRVANGKTKYITFRINDNIDTWRKVIRYLQS